VANEEWLSIFGVEMKNASICQKLNHFWQITLVISLSLLENWKNYLGGPIKINP